MPRGGGIKEYIQNLAENLSRVDDKNEYILYVLEDQMEYVKSQLKSRFKIKPIPFRGNSLFDVIRRSLLERFFWRREEQLEKWDVFHSPFFHGPKLKNTPLVLTIHDMRFFRFPTTYTFLRYQFLKRAVRDSVRRAKHIISISQFTKDEICEAYSTPVDKITVIHEAINRDHFSEQPLTDNEDKEIVKKLSNGRFLLTVGHLEPRKNYDRLIAAFDKVRQKSDEELYLVIVGKKGHSYEETLKLIDSNDHVMYLNFVSLPLLNWLYKNAEMFVFPSYYEGFGFPPLEAASHGTISAVSNVSSIPEVCGDAAIYFDPLDENDMASKLHTLLTDRKLQQELKSKLEGQLDKFSWKKNAEETVKIYEKVKNE